MSRSQQHDGGNDSYTVAHGRSISPSSDEQTEVEQHVDAHSRPRGSGRARRHGCRNTCSGCPLANLAATGSAAEAPTDPSKPDTDIGELVTILGVHVVEDPQSASEQDAMNS